MKKTNIKEVLSLLKDTEGDSHRIQLAKGKYELGVLWWLKWLDYILATLVYILALGFIVGLVCLVLNLLDNG